MVAVQKHDFDTRHRGLNPESCTWLGLGNKSTLIKANKCSEEKDYKLINVDVNNVHYKISSPSVFTRKEMQLTCLFDLKERETLNVDIHFICLLEKFHRASLSLGKNYGFGYFLNYVLGLFKYLTKKTIFL